MTLWTIHAFINEFMFTIMAVTGIATALILLTYKK